MHHDHDHHHDHDETHICPKTGKCCGRCKLAVAVRNTASTVETGAGQHPAAPAPVLPEQASARS